MKAILSSLAAVTMFCAVQAQTPISSVNAAGYIKVTLEAGKFSYLQVPFNKFDATEYSLVDIFGTSLPNLSQVYIWNGSSYVIYTYRASSNVWLPNLPTLARGEGFFVKLTGTLPVDVFLYGEVPGATSNATTTFSLIPGFTSIGFPYPTATTVENSGLTAVTSNLDQVYLFNSATGSYTIVTRRTNPDRWLPADTVVNPGQAFFVKRGSSAPVVSYVATVPYSWPNN